MNSKWRLDGKVALVTGSSRGIGLSTARELATLGAKVLLTARDAGELRSVGEQLAEEGLEAYVHSGDLSLASDRHSLIAFVEKTFGRLDVLVNNAGKAVREKALATDEGTWDNLLKLNLISAAELCRGAFPLLKVGHDASIVNVSSIAGNLFLSDRTGYGTTKAALSHLTRSLAAEWAKEGIRVNAVSPWFTKTRMTEAVLANPERIGPIVARTPMGRIADAEEIARVIAFLALPAASYVTGQDILVDGGMSVFAM